MMEEELAAARKERDTKVVEGCLTGLFYLHLENSAWDRARQALVELQKSRPGNRPEIEEMRLRLELESAPAGQQQRAADVAERFLQTHKDPARCLDLEASLCRHWIRTGEPTRAEARLVQTLEKLEAPVPGGESELERLRARATVLDTLVDALDAAAQPAKREVYQRALSETTRSLHALLLKDLRSVLKEPNPVPKPLLVAGQLVAALFVGALIFAFLRPDRVPGPDKVRSWFAIAATAWVVYKLAHIFLEMGYQSWSGGRDRRARQAQGPGPRSDS